MNQIGEPNPPAAPLTHLVRALRSESWAAADASEMLALATAQKVAPLLAANWLSPAVSTQVPAEVITSCQEVRRRTTQRVLLQLAELRRVTEALTAAGIRTLTFKGPLLAQQAYGDVTLRSCFDLDLFLAETQVLAAKRVLLGLGYQPEFTFHPHEEADLLRTECEYTFIHAHNGVRLDVQWRPRARFFSFPVPAQALWKRAVRVELNGLALETFALEDLVLYLVAHGAKHTWHRLEQVSALAGLLQRNPALDWPGVEAAARAAGAERMLFVAVHLVTQYFSAPVPAALAQRAARDREAVALAGIFAQQWTNSPQPHSLFATLRLHLRLRERWRDRVRHCFWLAVTPTSEDWLQHPLPPAWHWLHFALRPVRLMRKYVLASRG